MDKTIKKVFTIGLFLIPIIFNPFIVAHAYVDTTQSFSFIATNKVYFLLILNFVILILWTLKIRKTQELRLINTPMYFALFLWILSIILSSLIFTKNLNITFWGFNGTLENSLVEALSLITFFFILINNIEKNEDIKSLIRAFICGINFAFIYHIIRFIDTWQIDYQLLGQFINNSYFSPLGHYGSIIILSIISILFSIALIFSNTNMERSDINYKNFSMYLDILNIVISGLILGILVNFRDRPEYMYLILFAAGVFIMMYFYISYLNNRGKQKSKVTTLLMCALPLIMSFLAGILINLYLNKAQPQLPSLKFDHTWSVVLDSIKQDYLRGTFGLGLGNFVHSFDSFKSESLAIPILDNKGEPTLTNFTVNSHQPYVEEIRIYHPGSIVLNILYNQGLFGIVSFILIIGFAIYIVVNKGLKEANFISLSSTITLIIMVISMIFSRYDFILLFTFWLILGILIISYNRDEPFYNLMIGLSSKFSFNQNLGFILPLFFSIINLITLILTFRIFPANYLFYEARLNQADLDRYESLLFSSYKFFPESNLIGRELAYAKALKLDREVSSIQKELININENKKDNSDDINNQNEELLIRINRIVVSQNEINQIINTLISMHPDEYKNYFLQGIIAARVSEIQNFTQDERALLLFSISLNKNPFHPESHYNRSRILLRNAKSQNDIVAANNEILVSLKYRPYNLLYITHQANIDQKLGKIIYDQVKQEENQTNNIDTNRLNTALTFLQNAQNRYKALEQIYNQNPNNSAIINLYENIKTNKEESEKLIEEIQKILNSNKNKNDQSNKK